MASAIESYHQTLGTGESNQSNAQIAEYLQREKNQKELTNERGFISRILNTANSLICVFDNTGNVLKFNAECERVVCFKSFKMRLYCAPSLFPLDIHTESSVLGHTVCIPATGP
jgi:transcriptional regulator with PAS, ATPase and Fis domain